MTLTKYKDLQELFQNCIFYYTGEINSDGKLADIIGNYNGTIYNATKTGTDRFGITNRVYSFNGSSAYVNTGYSPNSLTEYTIVIWMNAESTSWRMGSRVNDSGTPPFLEWYAGNDAGSYVMHMRVSNNGNKDGIIYPYIYPSINKWQMRAYTFKASTGTNGLKFYIDGMLCGIADTTNIPSTTTGNYALYLGATFRGDVGASQFYTGKIGEVMFFNKTLSEMEIKTLHNIMSKDYIYPLLPGVRCSL